MNIKKLAVVGGGTAGIISALILKTKFPNMQIDIICSSDIGIVGVGEGSTEHFKEFMQFVGIDQYSLIKHSDASYKMGIMFDGWSETPYMHSLQTPFVKRHAQYNYLYGKLIAEKANNKEFSSPIYWENLVNFWYFNRPDEYFSNQFHFNTFKLNEFLSKLSITKGINIIDDIVQDVQLAEDGSIDLLKCEKSNYQYDFYIDCTGFRRILISKLGAKWKSYSKYLKMKSAITFPSPDEENYNIWTLSKTMDYGWMFKIPVWGRHGNGYIFDSDYISKDQAVDEVEKLLGKSVDIGRSFNFDPGALDKAWIKNCCAIGLSGSFVEPLEASSIGTSIQQAFLLMHRLSNYNDKVIDSYNKSFNDIMENIRDFIVLHYITKKTNSKFWIDTRNNEIPDSLKHNLDIWQHKLPIREDFANLSNYILFTEDNFSLVMQGLDLFNQQSIKQEFESSSQEVKNAAQQTINDYKQFLETVKLVSHKDMLSLIRTL